MSFTTPESNDVTRTAHANDCAATLAAAQVEREIDRYNVIWPPRWRSLSLHFPAGLEGRFEAETRLVRVRELRLTMFLAIGFYFLTTITDPVFVPDIGLAGLGYRFVALPLMLPIFVWLLSGVIRETIVMLAGIVSVVMLVTIPSVSTAPLAPYAYGTAVLALIYINTTFPLRFYYSCAFTVFSVGLLIFAVFHQSGMDFGLQWTMSLQVAIAGSFSLIANYRIERSVRLNYLFALREALRLDVLAADRAVLATLSNTDALTGIANRGYFDRCSTALLANPASVGRHVALLLLDIDYFKRYNDHYGHVAGDACLRAVAQALAAGLRDMDTVVARYGGEEFAVLLADVTPANVKTVAVRICESVAALGLPHAGRDDGVGVVTVSVGSALMAIGDRPPSTDSLIEVADQALYAAKRGGRNRHEAGLSVAA